MYIQIVAVASAQNPREFANDAKRTDRSGFHRLEVCAIESSTNATIARKASAIKYYTMEAYFAVLSDVAHFD